jgi:NAD(P)-dependent dehydrogenase (short-subunit alcohol dehydrogenase family)
VADVLDFSGRVAVVTGAGGGLGRAHALLLASRGARVVVNDIGVEVDGSGGSVRPAELVAAEINAAGGTAIADGHTVATEAGAAAIIAAAIDAFSRVDVVVNNAGTTGRMTMAEFNVARFDNALATHLHGAFWTIKAAWPGMVERGHGRIVNTASGVGYFGMGAATVYAAAKMGIDGLTRSLAIEGEQYGIRANCVAPLARTRMAGSVFGELTDRLDPSLVSSVVAYLAHDDCQLNGRVLSAGGGRVAELFIGATMGYFDEALTPEAVAGHLAEAINRTGFVEPIDALDEVKLLARLYAHPGNPAI